MTAKNIAADIAAYVFATGKYATLATDCKAWYKRVVCPYEGYNLPDGIDFDDFSGKGREIIEELEQQGCYFRRYPGASGIGLVSSKPIPDLPEWEYK